MEWAEPFVLKSRQNIQFDTFLESSISTGQKDDVGICEYRLTCLQNSFGWKRIGFAIYEEMNITMFMNSYWQKYVPSIITDRTINNNCFSFRVFRDIGLKRERNE